MGTSIFGITPETPPAQWTDEQLELMLFTLGRNGKMNEAQRTCYEACQAELTQRQRSGVSIGPRGFVHHPA